MNINSSSLNFERGVLQATAHRVMDIDASDSSDWEFKRVLGNITQKHPEFNGMTQAQLNAVALLVTVCISGYLPGVK